MSAPQKISPKEARAVAKRYQRGEGIRTIAEALGCSYGAVRNALLRRGVTLRGVGRPSKEGGGR